MAIIDEDSSSVRYTAAAFLAIFVGIGLSRFGYTPLIPALIEAGWFSPPDAAYLGAANFLGYLIGALGARQLASWSCPRATLRVLMLVASLAFAASAFPLPFLWFFAWRLVSGVTGGALMVLATLTALKYVPRTHRGLASGVIFTGVGIGIIVSGILVPQLLTLGLQATWLAFATISFAATGIAWFWWPAADEASTDVPVPGSSNRNTILQRSLLAICVSYGLIALGLVPHMVFLVDFIARGLGMGMATGGALWILFGIGAAIGPLASGRLADRFGFGPTVRPLLMVYATSVGILAFDHSTGSLVISSLLVGSAVSGTVPLVLGQTQERVQSPDAQKAVWGLATATFALGQAGGGYIYAFLFAAWNGAYGLLFLLGSVAFFIAFLMNLSDSRRDPLAVHQ